MSSSALSVGASASGAARLAAARRGALADPPGHVTRARAPRSFVAGGRSLGSRVGSPRDSRVRAAGGSDGSDNASSSGGDSDASGEEEDASDPSALLSGAADDVAPALEGDWRDFRARLVSQESGVTESVDEDYVQRASGPNLELLRKQNPALAEEKPWAHAIGAPERGCLLVAKGDEFTVGQQYFHQAVILLLDHGEQGSMGVILNRPTQYSMGYVSGDDAGPFADNALYFGGDVGDGTVSFLHGSGKVAGSVEVLPGVYLGGYESACELVKEGEVDASECKFFARYCGWGPGQLRGECERGVWTPVAYSKQIALKQVIQLPKPLWREVSELVGGEVGAASRRAYGEDEDEEEKKEE